MGKKWHKGKIVHRKKSIAQKFKDYAYSQGLKAKITTLKAGYRVDKYY